jgi:glutamyl-tRNA synthetase
MRHSISLEASFMSVRVRYAPSPTGYQHIGGVRTALYNYLFARSQGGKFILRIEDTDRERYVEEALKDIYDTFSWLGFHWDEGPDVGGPCSPYFQSQRLAHYTARAAELLENDYAYRCYCTSERLSKLREAQAAAKSGQGYDRHCRSLSDAERREAEASGAASVIRLKVPIEGITNFTDALLGDIAVENADINPDPVLIKSDGFPTYHMANVVDDHLMEITHIMRAQEWLPSAPLHMILYRAFDWEPPVLCHLPMVMGKDGQKLSKRHGATNVREFKRLGYLPEALLNYIALVGWSYDDSREFFSLSELEKLFSLEKINKSPAVFDYQKLEWFNGSYIRKKTTDELASLIKPVLEEAGLTADSAMLLRIAPLIQERVKLLSEVPEMVRFLFEEPAAPSAEALIPKKTDPARALDALQRADSLLGELSDLGEEAETRFRALSEELGIKLGDLLMPIRIAVTGAKVSPPLFGSIAAMGVERARARIGRAASILADHVGRS